MTQLVWYAAYGSNLSRSRFDCYLKGGRAEGAAREYEPSRDTSDPRSHRPWNLPGALVFGKESLNWTGGGVAFLDTDSSEKARGRLYLVTHAQFEDIVAQENHRPVGDVTLPSIGAGYRSDLEQGFYPLVIVLGELDDYPIATITDRLSEHRKPSPAYLRHVAQGLRESHHMSDYQIADYLSGRPGIVGAFDASELLSAVRLA